MNLTKALDLAIKLSETNETAGGYLAGQRCYDTYMTNDEWASFKASLRPDSLKEYEAGGGGELEEKSGRPPKMASYGSSSRMIYKLSHKTAGFHFEKKLATTVGGTANLDGFYENDRRYVFVEAKCHEPYSSKATSVSKSYESLYRRINASMAGNVEIRMRTSKCGRYLDVEYFSDGERLSHFDLKQMICHLLGIATGILTGALSPKQMDFIYLLYDPTELPLASDALEAISSIYERTCYECNLIDFATLFRVILSFLKENSYGDAVSDGQLDELVGKFTFSLASQDFYSLLLSSIDTSTENL